MKTAGRYITRSATWLWRLVFVSVLVFSLAFNVLAIFGGAVFSAVSGAVASFTGTKTLLAQHADEVADLNANLLTERRVQRELREEVADLSGDLAVARAANRKLRADHAADLVQFKGRKIGLREAVEETADTVSSRAAKSASREIGSMAGEALPYVGTAVIVGVTALEIRDLCETIRDMNSLKRTFNPDLQPSEDELTVCSMAVPSRQELWNATISAPGKAWEYSKVAVPRLVDFSDIELPSWGDLFALWEALRDGAEGRWNDSVDRGGEFYQWLRE